MDGDMNEEVFETKLASYANQDGIDYASIVENYLVDSSGRRLLLNPADKMRLLEVLDKSMAKGTYTPLLEVTSASTLATSKKSGILPDDPAAKAVSAGLQDITRQMDAMNQELTERMRTLNNNLVIMNNKVMKIEDQLIKYIEQDKRDKALQLAETRRVAIKQALEQKYGHNKRVRRSALGILQATDLAIVRTESVIAKSEDLMLETPGYWLAPALVSLSAWINDDPEVAKRAVAEAKKRDSQKAALFYALVNRRANRTREASAWLEAYLAPQKAARVDYKVIILLNAYACGLFGADEDGAIMQHLREWLDKISATEAARNAQVASWQKHFNNVGVMSFLAALDRKETPLLKFNSLRMFCPEGWPIMAECFGATYMNEEVLKWAKDAVETRDSNHGGLKGQVDHLLETLVSDFENEELKERKELDKNELIIELKGNEKFANHLMSFKEDLYKTSRNFADMIADAARYPKETHATHATQALAIGLELEWIREAYTKEVDAYRAKVPESVEVQIGTWKGVLTDGYNEEALVDSLVAHLNREEYEALAAARMKTWQIVCMIGGGVLAVIALIALIVNFATKGDHAVRDVFMLLIGGVGLGYGFISLRAAKRRMEAIKDDYRRKRECYTILLRKTIADYVDWRREFKKRDEVADEVKKYLAEIEPVKLIANQAEKYEKTA